MAANQQTGSEAPPAEARQRIAILDPLRGLAALCVVWFHFSSTGNFVGSGKLAGWLTLSGQHAWAGVEIFFVISGFVLPYALSKNGYRLRHFGTFLCKRLMRLEPPYLASIAIVLAIAALSPLVSDFHGAAFKLEWPRLLSHLGYLTSFLNYEWYNIVYWTLAIELQFYLSIALLFPLLVHRHAGIRWAVIAGLLLLSLVSQQNNLLFKYLPFFTLGIVSFQYYTGSLRMRAWWFWIAASACLCFFTMGAAATFFAVISAMAIAGSRALENRIDTGNKIWLLFTWLGTISYSLYLLHVPVGGRVINLGARFTSGPLGHIAVLAAALFLSLLASWLLHRYVEKPSQRWSSKLEFGNKPAVRNSIDNKSGIA